MDTSTTSDTPTPPRRVGPEETLLPSSSAQLDFTATAGGFTAVTRTQKVSVDAGSIRMTPRSTGPESSVELSTSSIRRDDVDLDITSRGINADGATLTIDRGQVREVIENRGDALEQSWQFAAAPAGTADLVISVGVRGQSDVRSAASGLELVTATGRSVSYSHAIWADANGTSWDIPAYWDRGEIVLTVPGSVLAESAYPAVLDPTITAGASVDTPVDGYTGKRARDPSVAWSPPISRYLAVWRDDRLSSDSDIYATRLTATGAIVDTRGIQVNAGLLVQSEPVVAFPGTGQAFVVAWTDNGGDIGAATVSSGAATATVAQLGLVAGTAAVETQPAIASNDAGALLVWQSDGDIRGARFLSGGSFGAPFNIATTAALETSPTVAAAPGGGYLVAWQEGATSEDIRGQLVTATGTLSGTVFDISTGTPRKTQPSAGFDGTDYVVAWSQASDIRGGRVTTAGALLDGVTGVVLASNPNLQSEPAVTCDSASCLVSWQERIDTTSQLYDVFGQRVGFDLTAQGGIITINNLLADQLRPAVTTPGSGFAAVWQDNRTGTQLAAFTRINAGGSVLDGDGVVLNTGRTNAETTPAYARTATSQLAVWADSRNLGDDIMARRYTGTGGKLDTGALVVSNANFEQGAPSVDFDGTQYLVAWQDRRGATWDVFAARFQADGTLSDPTGIPVGNAADDQFRPGVASGNNVSLVAWEDGRSGTGTDLYAAIVTPAGTIGVGDIPVCATTGAQLRPTVAWDPSGAVFVVAWLDERAGVGNADVYAARVQTDGTVLDPCGVLVSGAANDQRRPTIATSGSQLLVTWVDYRNDVLGDVYGSRLNTSGGLNVLDASGIAIATGASGQGEPTVGGLDTGGWGVVWADDVNPSFALDLYGNTILSTGALAGAQYPVSTGTTESESSPAFQSGVNTTNRLYLVYEKIGVAGDATRVARRKLTYP